jgi:hypothetical protein
MAINSGIVGNSETIVKFCPPQWPGSGWTSSKRKD